MIPLSTLSLMLGALSAASLQVNSTLQSKFQSPNSPESLFQSSPIKQIAYSKGDCSNPVPNPWCGGSQNPTKELSCTPFKYRPFQWNNTNPGNSWCANWQTLKTLTGVPDGGVFYNTYRAWSYFDSSGRNVPSQDKGSYWVFHGCDGAGIQPDCAGDIKYVERLYGPISKNGALWCEGGYTVDQIPSKGRNPRRQCKFKHPGTGNVYDNYYSGWWDDGDLNSNQWMMRAGANRWWNNAIRNAFTQKAGTSPFQGQAGDKLVMMIFPWVCDVAGADEDAAVRNGYYSPDSAIKNVKCWADNEPYTDGKKNAGWPPFAQLYYMLLTKENNKDVLKVRGYEINNSTMNVIDMNNGNSWNLYPCNPSNGDTCPF